MEAQHLSSKIKSSHLMTLIFSYVDLFDQVTILIELLCKRGTDFLNQNWEQLEQFCEKHKYERILKISLSRFQFRRAKIRRIEIVEVDEMDLETNMNAYQLVDEIVQIGVLKIFGRPFKRTQRRSFQKQDIFQQQNDKMMICKNDKINQYEYLISQLILKSEEVQIWIERTNFGLLHDFARYPELCQKVKAIVFKDLAKEDKDLDFDILICYQDLEFIEISYISAYNFQLFKKTLCSMTLSKLQRFSMKEFDTQNSDYLLEEVFSNDIQEIFSTLVELDLCFVCALTSSRICQFEKFTHLKFLKLAVPFLNYDLLNNWPNLQKLILSNLFYKAPDHPLELKMPELNHIEFEAYQNLEQHLGNFFIPILKSFPKLQTVSMQVYFGLDSSIFQVLSSLPELRTVSLILIEYNQKGFQTIPLYEMNLSNNYSIQNLKVEFDLFRSSAKKRYFSVCFFLQFFQVLKQLKTFSLKNLSSLDVNEQDYKKLCDLISDKGPRLNMRIEFLRWPDAVVFFQKIDKTRCFESLEIPYSDAIDEDVIENLSKMIKRNKSLKCLKISVNFHSFSSTIYSLFDAISTHPNILSFELNIEKFQLTRNGEFEIDLLKYLATRVSLYCTKLRKLCISIRIYNSPMVIIDYDLNAVIFKLGNDLKCSLPKIQELIISF